MQTSPGFRFSWLIFARASALSIGLFASVVVTSLSAQDAFFRRGDVDADGVVGASDAVAVLRGLFDSLAAPACLDAADANDDGHFNVTDAVTIVRFLFLGASAPPFPFDECGGDGTPDSLPCASFPPCAVTGVPCLSEATFSDLVASVIDSFPELTICLPAGLLDLPVAELELSVCPGDAANPCGEAAELGCPIDLVGVQPFLDLENRVLGVRLEGRVEQLPIAITEPVFGTTTLCRNDIHAEGDPEAPFVVELRVPFEVAPREDGLLEVVSLGEAEMEPTSMELESSGGLVCTLFEGVQDVFLDLLLLPLETALSGFQDGVSDALVGVPLCP